MFYMLQRFREGFGRKSRTRCLFSQTSQKRPSHSTFSGIMFRSQRTPLGKQRGKSYQCVSPRYTPTEKPSTKLVLQINEFLSAPDTGDSSTKLVSADQRSFVDPPHCCCKKRWQSVQPSVIPRCGRSPHTEKKESSKYRT